MTSDVNTADSLRAAALSTIKAKRKKPEKPIRPQPAPASLDYGQDDALTTPVLESNPVNPSSNPETTSDQPSHGKSDSLTATKEDEDVQMREEGEISDEDGGRISQAPQLADPTPEPVVVHTGSVALAPAPVVKEEPESPKDNTLNFPIPVVSTVTTEDIVMDELAASPAVPDSSQTRPGFILNQAQYDRAKDLVLDLLGWGVPSEYLVDCGLSREIVFYVFSELQLRLPANLDVTGLSLGTGRTSSSHLTSLQSSSVPSSEPHLDLIDPPPTSSTLQPPISLAIPSLHDIEQQRRNELLARKAAQTYQRVIQDSNTPSHPMEQDHDMAMTPVPVIEEAVDDFLKTITPSAESQMKMDDSQAVMDTEMEDSLAALEDPPQQDDLLADPPPLSGQSTSTTFSDVPPPPSSVSTPSTASFPPDSTTSEQFPRESTSGTVSRRGGQRPVAADFVDFEASSSHGPSPSYRDSIQSNSHVPSRHRQSSTSSSFASVSGARRCVIDLSDSEDDARNLEMIDSGLNGTRVLNRHYRADISLGKYDPPVTTGGLQTPTPGIDRGMSPASLEEKVQEIKRMRELIAKREQSRLTKLSRSSSVLHTPNADAALSTSDIVNSLLPGMVEDSAGLDPSGSLSNAQLQSKSPLINHELDDVQPFAHPVLHGSPLHLLHVQAIAD